MTKSCVKEKHNLKEEKNLGAAGGKKYFQKGMFIKFLEFEDPKKTKPGYETPKDWYHSEENYMKAAGNELTGKGSRIQHNLESFKSNLCSGNKGRFSISSNVYR